MRQPMNKQDIPWNKIKNAYLQGKGPRELSENFGVPYNTIKSRISREKWSKERTVPAKSRGGAPSKFTDSRMNRFLEAYAACAPIRTCCEYAGISVSTYYNWLSKGELNEPGYVEFLESVRKLDLQVQIRLLQDIEKSSSWQAKAWILKNRWPDRYSDRSEHFIEGLEKERDGEKKKNSSEFMKYLSHDVKKQIANAIIKARHEQQG